MRHRRSLLAICLSQILLCLACSAYSQNQPGPKPPIVSGDTWLVRYTTVGDIAGVQKQLEIHSTGRLSARDLRANREAVGTASPELIREITAALKEAKPDTDEITPPALPDAVYSGVTVLRAGRETGIRLPEKLAVALRLALETQLRDAAKPGASADPPR